MELQLIRSFLEVAESGSFAAASDRLFVTQSAVSLRIQRLEDQLGRPLFLRSKDGVTLTAAGREFRSFAVTILRNWEQARQRVSAADEVRASLAIGAQHSLWPRFGFRWLDSLREAAPDLALRAEMARPDGLSQMILSGNVQVILSYAPLARAGLRTESLLEEQLVMVAPFEGAGLADLKGRYLLVDWGPDFLRFHEEALAELHDPALVMALGSLSARFILSRPFAAYLPARYVKRYVDKGRLHLVADAPVWAMPAWVIWREDMDSELRDVAQATLNAVVERAEEDTADLLDTL
ncbi:LysR family transcriptional regulator [Pseudogemmobacter humi]|uniref:HTH-type transcriptional regulator CynR n=1 Tax=Pseudogemmobacter humi TaxID=2483812 RepID=A0A3P5X8P2_9RHOB|nr:LysR family transcriptional regulator [Pseudogemmobacter humi]VDC30820.1 HTH-type transcriptional regulator CynR [Pseudogemmobacter humi]